MVAAGGGGVYSVDVLGALHLIVSAWNNVPPETIRNCFHHAGFSMSNLEVEPVDDAPEMPEGSHTWKEFLDCDTNISVCHDSSLQDLVNEISIQCSSDEEEEEEARVVTFAETWKGGDMLQSFLQQHSAPTDMLFTTEKVMDYVGNEQVGGACQTTLDDFFKKI